jgi:TetR/AcrR family transcriptional repressor of lmrAB and yxaGH operons
MKGLIEQLKDVFIEHGFHGTTLAELARATSLSKASLYHHFPGGKQEMAATMIRTTIEDFQRLAWRHLQSKKKPTERLLAFIDGFAIYCKDGHRPCLLAILGQHGMPSHTNTNLDQLIHAQFADWQTQLSLVYAELGCKPKKSGRLANQLLAELYGALLIAKMHNEPRLFSRHMKQAKKSAAQSVERL